MKSYNRKIQVIVGERGKTGIKKTENRISFKVPMTSSRYPNKATVKIWNVGESFSGFFDKKDLVLELRAGYGTPEIIFTGEVKKVTADNSTPEDQIVILECSGGGRPYRGARVSKTWSGQVKLKEVVTEIADAFGVPVDLDDRIDDITLKNGYTIFGPARDELQDLAESLGFDWFFQNERIVTTQANKPLDNPAVLLSSSTGLIGRIQKTSNGVSGKCLLNPSITPKSIVKIDTINTTGYFEVLKVEHSGDRFSDEFYTSFESRII